MLVIEGFSVCDSRMTALALTCVCCEAVEGRKGDQRRGGSVHGSASLGSHERNVAVGVNSEICLLTNLLSLPMDPGISHL